MKGKMIADMSSSFSFTWTFVTHCNTPNHPKLLTVKRKSSTLFNPINADILLTHSNSCLRADAKDIMEMIH